MASENAPVRLRQISGRTGVDPSGPSRSAETRRPCLIVSTFLVHEQMKLTARPAGASPGWLPPRRCL